MPRPSRLAPLVPTLVTALLGALLVPTDAGPPDDGVLRHVVAQPAARGSVPGGEPRRDLPEGVPAAARRPEPELTVPRGWPFEQRISRTSGTGRLHGGADYWTDFVYDDRGAAIPSGFTLENTAMLAPYQGVYTYPDDSVGGVRDAARGNGADVFVAAVGADDDASYWRVDWNTLADPRVPLAVWALDTDGSAGTGAAQWPAGAGVRSAGIERALVVSSRGAWLHDLRSGAVVDVEERGGALSVDRDARSFVVRVPDRLLPTRDTWRVRLGTGLAAPDGRTLASPQVLGGPPPGAPRLYNVAYRGTGQERAVVTDSSTAALVAAYQAVAGSTPPLSQLGADGQARFVTGNFWSEDAQADALALGDVTAFSRQVRWGELRDRRATPEPLVHGHSNRWYVSRLRLGQGVQTTDSGRPDVLGRIQPYQVYVPRSYRPGQTLPLTWTLHSLDVNHNQYAAYNPALLQRLCEERHSICVGTLGHGPDGWYFDEAEVDFWSVWGTLGRSFRLDHRRTVLTGYSMGGWAAYHLGLAHPDLFAEAVSLAGPPQCGVSLDGDQLVAPAFGGDCTTDGTAFDLVGNARWLPYRIGHGTGDQLVPFPSVEAQVARLDALGLRHRFVRYPGEDHLIFATQDRFDAVVGDLDRPVVVRDPRTIDFTWRPHLTRPALGIGATTAYWVTELAARDRRPGALARIEATSMAIPARAATPVRSAPEPIAAPLPAVRTELTWRPGRPLPVRPVLRLRLRNVASLDVDLDRARLWCGRIEVRTDGATRLRLVRQGTVVRHVLLRRDGTLSPRC